MSGVNNLSVARLPRDSEHSYTKVPNCILRLEKISLKAKSILFYLIGEKDKTCMSEDIELDKTHSWTLTLKGLTSKCKESIGCVKHSMDELMRMGFVLRADILGPRNLRIRCEYIVYEDPIYNPSGKPVIIREEDFEKLKNEGGVNLIPRYKNINIAKNEDFFKLRDYEKCENTEDREEAEITENEAEDEVRGYDLNKIIKQNREEAKEEALRKLKAPKVKKSREKARNNAFDKEEAAVKNEACQAVVREAIESDIIAEDFGKTTVERTVGIIAKAINSDKNISIGARIISPRDAASVLLRLSYYDVYEVLKNVQRQKNIHKWDKYVLKSLYKAAELSPDIAVGSKTVAIVEMEELIIAKKRGELEKWLRENFSKLRPLSQQSARSYIRDLYKNDAEELERINTILG